MKIFWTILIQIIFCAEYDHGDKILFENGGNILATASDINRVVEFKMPLILLLINFPKLQFLLEAFKLVMH